MGRFKPVPVVLGAVGVLAYVVACCALRDVQFHVVRYRTVSVPDASYLPPTVLALVVLLALVVAAGLVTRSNDAGGRPLDAHRKSPR